MDGRLGVGMSRRRDVVRGGGVIGVVVLPLVDDVDGIGATTSTRSAEEGKAGDLSYSETLDGDAGALKTVLRESEVGIRVVVANIGMTVSCGYVGGSGTGGRLRLGNWVGSPKLPSSAPEKDGCLPLFFSLLFAR